MRRRVQGIAVVAVVAMAVSRATSAAAQEQSGSASTPVVGLRLTLPGNRIAFDAASIVPLQLQANGETFSAYRLAPDTVLVVPQQSVARKDPAVAGLLSLLIPGVGSFYAGNSGHGVRHLVIHLGSVVVVVAGLASTTNCASVGCVDSGLGIYAIGYVAYLGNLVWSIFTAVGDANAHNGGTKTSGTRVVGSLYVDPQVRVLGSRSVGVTTPRSTMPRAEVQLLSLRF